MAKIRVYTTKCPHCGKLIDQQSYSPRTEGLPYYRCFHCGKIFKTDWKIPECTPPKSKDKNSAFKMWICSVVGFLILFAISSGTDIEIPAAIGVPFEITIIVVFCYSSYILYRYHSPKYPSKDFYLKIKEEDPELYWLNYREIVRVFPELSEDQPDEMNN